GRGQETFGEDPYLTGEFGVAIVRGLQGDDPKYLKLAACAKHFWGHSGPEAERHQFDAKISKRDATQTYLPAFKKLVTEAKVESVMGAYNRTNGQVCCGSAKYIRELLRKKWGFKGHFVSDCWAIMDFHKNHKVTPDQTSSAAYALKNGCNLNCGCSFEKLLDAYEKKMIAEADLDDALRHVLMTRMKLGCFDRNELVPLAKTPISKVHCAEHRAIALEAARKSVVLLKNDGILPLKPTQKLNLAGPNLASLPALWGNYNGFSDTMTTVLEGIVANADPATSFEPRKGIPLNGPAVDHSNEMWFYDRKGPVVFVAGLDESIEGEEGDGNERNTIKLPDSQRALLSALYKEGYKVVLVVMAGSPVDLREDVKKASAIVYASYPGEAGGTAIAEVLFGKTCPSGRLPFTIPLNPAKLPDYHDYSMANRTYRYMKNNILFPFGAGLSYTEFRYSNARVAGSLAKKGRVTVSANVTNVGGRAGDEVVQLYISHTKPGVEAPLVELKGFQRIHLEKGGTARVSIEVPAEAFRLVDAQGRWFMPKDDVEVFFGHDSRTLASKVLTVKLAK
ncbi:MAG: glycoside hydrolase family 3 C-terminal domain-containing protein, partial [Lentisphaeria bacterium]|nr:glycoside hydrolase family 3 C-terminal domain-containing protein [Lentisphaeria bacterium]